MYLMHINVSGRLVLLFNKLIDVGLNLNLPRVDKIQRLLFYL